MAAILYSWYFSRDTCTRTDPRIANTLNDIKNEIALQNLYISIKNKSQSTHKGVDTHLIVTKFIKPISFRKQRNYVTIIKTSNITKIINSIIKGLTERAKVYKYRAPVEIIFYTMRDINIDLIENLQLIEMFAVTKDILLDSHGVNITTIDKYNISTEMINYLLLAKELNTLIKYPSRKYLIKYYTKNNIGVHAPKWYTLTSTIQNNCIQFCIDRINEAFTENA